MVQGKPFDFRHATALVVGGGTGLGFVMAQALLDHGASVCVASRTEAKVKACADALSERFDGRCFGLAVDVTDEASLSRLMDAVSQRFDGGLNIAINSAGMNIRNPIEKISLDEWETIHRVNLTGGFLLAKAVFPLLRNASWARLIHVTSVFGSRSYAQRASYASSKGGLLQLTRTLAIEWAPHGITVNSISPGPFLTDINRAVVDNPENYRTFCENIPLGRFGNPEEIAPACLFLASPHSSYVTGADVALDGGWAAG